MYCDQLPSRIGNIKVHSRRRDCPALRMHIGNVFSSLDLQPPGMPPSAILIVRKIYDPMPGVLRPVSGAKYGPGNNNKDAWRDALRLQLSNLYRKAGRPAKTAVVGEQEAVVFADHAELLACFCRDTVVGAQARQWWWKSHYLRYLRTMVPAGVAARLFTETPRAVPAVMNLLAEWGCAVKLIKMIDASSARQIIQAVLHEYGLAGLDGKLRNHDYTSHDMNLNAVDHSADYSQAATAAEAHPSVYNDNVSGVDGSRSCDFGTDSTPALPWLNLFQNEIWEPGLMKEQLALLGIARLLQSSPVILRNSHFQKQITNWWSKANQAELRHPEPDLRPAQINRVLIAQEKDRGNGHKPRSSAAEAPDIIFDWPDSECNNSSDKAVDTVKSNGLTEVTRAQDILMDIGIKSETVRQTDSSNADHQSHGYLPGQHGFFGPGAALATHADKPGGSEHGALEPDSYSEAVDKTALDNEFADAEKPFSESWIDTKLGGLLYLINLLQQLDLPRCLSEQWKVDQQVSRWALLDAVSRALMGKHYFLHRRDPVWRLLAGLDHRRTKTLIGRGFQRQPDYEMPKEWFRYITDRSAQRFYWALHNKCLRVWSESGIVIQRRVSSIDAIENQVLADLQQYSEDISEAQIHVGCYAQAPVANRRQLHAAGIDQEFARLLSLLLPPIRQYLQDILSLSSVTPHQLLNELLHCDAQIFVSSSHVDLVADISSTTLAIRRSGLDQDPGWLPMYGRVVLFHFTQA